MEPIKQLIVSFALPVAPLAVAPTLQLQTASGIHPPTKGNSCFYLTQSSGNGSGSNRGRHSEFQMKYGAGTDNF